MKEARYTFQDPVTAALAAALGSDRVHVLPPPLPNGRHDHQRQGFDEAKVKPPNVGRPSAAALAMVADAQIDVLVYPELGMDAITVRGCEAQLFLQLLWSLNRHLMMDY